MKVLNLVCSNGHPFEGWFSNEDDYRSQHDRGLLTCPMCEDKHVEKTLTAPRLNLRNSKESRMADPPSVSNSTVVAGSGEQRALLRTWLEMSRKLAASTEDVGEQFADEARKIHYGEAEERGIRGKASAAQFRALVDEGIEVMPLILPEVAKGTLQ